MRLGCKELRADKSLDCGCCRSCHEDILFGFPLCEVSPDMGDPVEKVYYVCCEVMNTLRPA